MDANETSPGTGALETSDAAAAAVTKGERITIDQLRDQIAGVMYFGPMDVIGAARFELPNAADTRDLYPALELLTICVLVLRNGFTVVGKSACADPSNFDAELGRKLARDDAEHQAWGYLGFRLRDKLAAATG